MSKRTEEAAIINGVKASEMIKEKGRRKENNEKNFTTISFSGDRCAFSHRRKTHKAEVMMMVATASTMTVAAPGYGVGEAMMQTRKCVCTNCVVRALFSICSSLVSLLKLILRAFFVIPQHILIFSISLFRAFICWRAPWAAQQHKRNEENEMNGIAMQSKREKINIKIKKFKRCTLVAYSWCSRSTMTAKERFPFNDESRNAHEWMQQQ